MNRQAIEEAVETLIGLLDVLDGDADHEPNTGDDEPSIGTLDDLELDTADDEPDPDNEWSYLT